MLQMFKSVLEQDRSAVVLCDAEHTIVYMNPVAIERHKKDGGEKLIGRSLMDCHNERSRQILEKVLAWFQESRENNMIYTHHNKAENKDVYIIALRDDEGKLLGYYEKYEYRKPETAELYDFSKSLI